VSGITGTILTVVLVITKTFFAVFFTTGMSSVVILLGTENCSIVSSGTSDSNILIFLDLSLVGFVIVLGYVSVVYLITNLSRIGLPRFGTSKLPLIPCLDLSVSRVLSVTTTKDLSLFNDKSVTGCRYLSLSSVESVTCTMELSLPHDLSFTACLKTSLSKYLFVSPTLNLSLSNDKCFCFLRFRTFFHPRDGRRLICNLSKGDSTTVSGSRLLLFLLRSILTPDL